MVIEQQKDELYVPVDEEEAPVYEVQQVVGETDLGPNGADESNSKSLFDELRPAGKDQIIKTISHSFIHLAVRQCRYRIVKKKVCQHPGIGNHLPAHYVLLNSSVRVPCRVRVRKCRMRTCVRKRGCRTYRYKCKKCTYRYERRYRIEYRWK